MRKIDLNEARKQIVAGIKSYLGDKKAVIGISGGVDSVLVLELCVEALGAENVYGVLLPCGKQSDFDEAFMLVEKFKIDNYRVLDILPIVYHFAPFKDDLSRGNVAARVRMTKLRQIANEIDGLVIGTTNRSEWWTGYFTKDGDGACDIEPIRGLYKTEVWQMSKLIGIPECIINKKPSANLWPGQTDEEEMDFLYSELDQYLQGDAVDPLVEEKIVKMIKGSEHKRRMAPDIDIETAVLEIDI